MAETVMTPEFRVSFPHVFTPQQINPQAEPKYSIVMLFPKGADLSALKKAAKEAAKEKWGDKLPSNLRDPFRDQGEKDYEGYEEGAIFITATSKQKPGLVDQNVNPILNQEDFYPGCYARATVRAFAYEVSGNRGVSFGLQNIQKLRDGEPIGGRARPESEFDPVGSDDEEIAETAGGLFD